MKKLLEWLEKKGMTQGMLAYDLGISESSLSRYINGSRKVPLAIAVEIEVVTKGKVKCQDLN